MWKCACSAFVVKDHIRNRQNDGPIKWLSYTPPIMVLKLQVRVGWARTVDRVQIAIEGNNKDYRNHGSSKIFVEVVHV